MAYATPNNRNSWLTAGTGRALAGGLLLLLSLGDLVHFPLAAIGCLAAAADTPDDEEEEDAERAAPRTLSGGHPGTGRLPRKPPSGPRTLHVTPTDRSRPTPNVSLPPAHPKQNGLGIPLLC